MAKKNKVIEEYVYHKFEIGDNRISLSEKYGTTPEKLAELNPGIENWLNIKPGERVRVV